jgi:hypothetical protein
VSTFARLKINQYSTGLFVSYSSGKPNCIKLSSARINVNITLDTFQGPRKTGRAVSRRCSSSEDRLVGRAHGDDQLFKDRLLAVGPGHQAHRRRQVGTETPGITIFGIIKKYTMGIMLQYFNCNDECQGVPQFPILINL